MPVELALIGTSQGGMRAMQQILAALPPDFALPLVLVIHRDADSELLVEILQRSSPFPVTDALDKQPLERGKLYVAPANYHLLIEAGHTALSTEAPVHFARPSIDAAFETAADAYGPRLLGILLTGSNHDGAAGLLKIKQRGGTIIVQDPATAEYREMPDAALAVVKPDHILKLDEIGPALVRILKSFKLE